MTLPKGLKAFLKDSSPGKLTKGKFKGYRAVDAHGAFEGANRCLELCTTEQNCTALHKTLHFISLHTHVQNTTNPHI